MREERKEERWDSREKVVQKGGEKGWGDRKRQKEGELEKERGKRRKEGRGW